MKVGAVLPMAENPETGAIPAYREIRDLARQAEAAGFDSVWLYDHLLYRFPNRPVSGSWEGWTLLSGVAEATERVELGTIVLCTAFRNPAVLAKMAVTLDEISAGRFILGLGAGWHQPEFDAFGIPFDHKAGRFEEALKIIVPMLREGEVTFEGQHYQARETQRRPRGPRPKGPPILIGSGPRSPRMLWLCATYADQWNGSLRNGRSHGDQVPPLREAVDAACRDVGRDPATVQRSVSIMVDQTGTREIGPSMKPENADPLTGSPEEIAAGLRAFEAEGIDHLQVYLVPNTIASIERFAGVLEIYKRG